jgi:outer membrane receptor for ferrienterochelin and colicins
MERSLSDEYKNLEGTFRLTHGDYRGSGTYVDVRVATSLRESAGSDVIPPNAVFDDSTGDALLEGSALVRLDAGPGTLTLTAGGTHWRHRYVHDQRKASAKDTLEDDYDEEGLVTALYAATFGEHSLAGGIDLLGERISGPTLIGQGSDRERGSIFLQDEWRLGDAPRLVATGGVRVDLDTQFGAVVTPRLAVRYDPVSGLALRASVGTGFRAPSFEELYLTLDHTAYGYTVDGNPALKPENTLGGTVSADWEPLRALTFSASLFWNQLWNMIAYKTLQTAPVQKLTYDNTARATTRGGELSVAWAANRYLTLGAGYTYTYARDLGTGYELENQSTHRLVGQLRLRLKEAGLTGFVRAAWTGKRPLVDGADVPAGQTAYGYLDPFLLLDARVGWTVLPKVEFFVAGNNLANAGNNNDLPLAPRSVFSGASFAY